MTDAPSGRELVEKTFVYMTTLSKECRKAITAKFEQAHKGIAFSDVEETLRKEIESWFAERDRNLRIQHEASAVGKPGQIMMTYAGSSKDTHFKFRVEASFTITGSSPAAPSYLKTVNVNLDKRDFAK